MIERSLMKWNGCDCDRSLHYTIDPFPHDVTYTRYYSAIIPGGATRASNVLPSIGKTQPAQTIPACELRLGIATRERPALLVEQGEHFQLPFVASPYGLPSWRYSLLEITLSFQNAHSVPILVSRPCTRDFWWSWLDKGTQSHSGVGSV